MNIVVGNKSGFCQGVAFTINKANEYIDFANSKNEKLYCLGEIVHNERVISDFKESGLIFVDELSNLPKGSKVIFRAHGERKEIYDFAKENGINVLDLTCGKVRAIKQKIISANNDSIVIIMGKKNHPETIGTFSFCDDGFIIENDNDLLNIVESVNSINKDKLFVVEQTTFNEQLFNELSSKIVELFPNYEVIINNTICNATHERQEETNTLSRKADCMIIIGGQNSSNTKELFNVSKENCEKTFLIQELNDLKKLNIDFTNINLIGIMAGASTPDCIVEEVKEYLKERN